MINCVYQMIWTEQSTGEQSTHTCGREIDLAKIAPYRQWHGFCHRHEHGLAGWKPTNCVGSCCAALR